MAKPKADEAAPQAYGPATQAYTLSSGRPVTLTQPDMFDLASGKIDLPNTAKRDVWDLLLRYTSADDPQQQLLADERWIRAHYYAAALCLEPKLKLDDDDDDKGEIDRRELSLPDLMTIYTFCRFGRAANPADRQPRSGDPTVPDVGDGKSAE